MSEAEKMQLEVRRVEGSADVVGGRGMGVRVDELRTRALPHDPAGGFVMDQTLGAFLIKPLYSAAG